MVEPRFQAMNQWSCALACVIWNLSKRAGIEKTQASLITDYGHLFPKWIHQPGLLERPDILKLLSNIISYRKFLHTNNREEFFSFHDKNKAQYLMGFILTRKNDKEIMNHCMALTGWSGDNVHVMEPARYNPVEISIPWTEVETKLDSDILALFA